MTRHPERKIHARALAAILGLLLSAVSAESGAGGLDPTFGTGGIVKLEGGKSTIGRSVAMLPGGGSVIAANAYRAHPWREYYPTIFLAQLLPDGSLDPAFGEGGVAHRILRADPDPDATSLIAALRRQDDGRLLIAGYAEPDSEGRTMAVMRLLADGTLDDTFGERGIASMTSLSSERVLSLVLQSDGRIILGSDAVVDGTRQLVLRRLDTSGALDTSFGIGGMLVLEPDPDVHNQLSDLVVWPDDAIGIVGVAFEGDLDTDVSVVAKLLANGSPDGSFGDGGLVVLRNGQWPSSAVVAPDGGLVIVTSYFGAMRLLADGTPDPGFGIDGFVQYPFDPFSAAFSNAIALDAEGRILIGGAVAPRHTSRYELAVGRLTAAGAPDLELGSGGLLLARVGSTATGFFVGSESDGRILVAGFADMRPERHDVTHVFVVARFDPGEGGCVPAISRLSIRSSSEGDVIAIKATFDPGDVGFDPIRQGVRLAATSADGTIFTANAPGGEFFTPSRYGWRTSVAGHRWIFIDETGQTGFRTLVIRRLDDGRMHLRARVRAAVDLPPSDATLRVHVGVVPDVCAAAEFTPAQCERGTDRALLCR